MLFDGQMDESNTIVIITKKDFNPLEWNDSQEWEDSLATVEEKTVELI